MKTFIKGNGYDSKVVFNHAVLQVHWEYVPNFDEFDRYKSSSANILSINDLDKSFFSSIVLEKVAEIIEKKELEILTN